MNSVDKILSLSGAVATSGLPFQPPPLFGGLLQDEAALARNQGKRIGILVVTDNVLATLSDVLKRIRPEVWQNVEEVTVFDDAMVECRFTSTWVTASFPALRSEFWA